MDKDADATAFIRRYVRSGYHDAAAIAEIVAEAVYYPELPDPDWLHRQIQQAFQVKKQDEVNWPITDCDKLDRVFRTLESQGILVLPNAGMTLSDGHTAIGEAWAARGGDDSGFVGYCFFHGQDLDRVLETGDLYLAFGGLANEGQSAAPRDLEIDVGKRILGELRAAGFLVVWNGTLEARILVKGINWQRRGQWD